MSSFGYRFDIFDERVASIDIDSCISVTERGAFGLCCRVAVAAVFGGCHAFSSVSGGESVFYVCRI